MLTIEQVRRMPPTLLHVNDIIPTHINQTYPHICKDVFNKIGAGKIAFHGTYQCFTKELEPSQQNIYSHKVRWMLGRWPQLPPISIMDFERHLFVIDGHHRLCAAILEGATEITCQVVRVNFATVNFH